MYIIKECLSFKNLLTICSYSNKILYNSNVPYAEEMIQEENKGFINDDDDEEEDEGGSDSEVEGKRKRDDDDDDDLDADNLDEDDLDLIEENIGVKLDRKVSF